MRVIDIDPRYILLDKKKKKKIIQFIKFHTKRVWMGSMPLPISFNEIDGFIKVYDRIRYLVLFGGGFL